MVKHKPVLWVLVSPVLKISESYTPEDLLQPIVIDFFLIDNFFSDFDFYRFPISIDNNRQIKLITLIDFRYRFLSINYAWQISVTLYYRGLKIYF